MASIVSASAAVVNSARNQASAGGCARPMPACRHAVESLAHQLQRRAAKRAAGCALLADRGLLRARMWELQR
jgi:hypothetical protein